MTRIVPVLNAHWDRLLFRLEAAAAGDRVASAQGMTELILKMTERAKRCYSRGGGEARAGSKPN